MPATRADLFAFLDRLGIETETHEHPPIYTVEEGRPLKAGLPPGGHTKNLFLKDKKGVLLLISAKDDTDVPLKGLHRHLDCGRLSFGNAGLLREALGVTPGSVTAFALLNDSQGRVRFILDAALTRPERIYFHPLENTASTSIAPAGLIRFAEACGHRPEIFDFAALGAQAPGN
ncbi:MAG: prolyl-tRNA synthetase associated domain-containing protein [Alphaproteobacteria bacterium]